MHSSRWIIPSCVLHITAVPAWTGQTLNALFLFRQKERVKWSQVFLWRLKTTPTYLNSFWGRTIFRVFIQLSVTDYLSVWHILHSNTDPPPPPKTFIAWKARINDSQKLHNYNEKPFIGGVLKLVVFIRRFRKISKSDSYLRRVCSSVRMEQLGSHWTNFYETWYLSIFRKSVEKIRVSLKPDKNNWYLTWRPMYIYDIISLHCP